MANVLTYNGTRSDSLGIIVTRSDSDISPERNVSRIKVPGKNGEIIVDNGNYNNVTLTYEIVLDPYTPVSFQSMAKWLLVPAKYCRLEESDRPNYFREAIYSGDLALTCTILNRYGKAKLTFYARPEKYYTTGESYNLTQSGDNSWGWGPYNDQNQMPTRPVLTINVAAAANLPSAFTLKVTTPDDATTYFKAKFTVPGRTAVAGKPITLDFERMIILIDGEPAAASNFDTLVYQKLTNEHDILDPNAYFKVSWDDIATYPNAVTGGTFKTRYWTL